MTVTKTSSVGFYNDLYEITRKSDASMNDSSYELVACISGKTYDLNYEEFLDLYEVFKEMYEEVRRMESE